MVRKQPEAFLDTTFANYRKVMNKHVLQAFGNTPITDITSPYFRGLFGI